MPRFRRAAAVAILSLLTMAACGGGSASKSAAPAESTTTTTIAPTPLDLVLASSDKVADVSTMRFTMTMGVPQGSFTAEGAMDTRGPLMSMTMDMASLIPPAERKAGTQVSMVLNDQALYMKYPGLAAETGGKNWLRFDLATLGEGNPLKPMIDQMREADPSKNVAFLEGAQDVTTVGTEDVRGVSTTHYKFKIDLQKAMAQVPENLRNLLSDALAKLGSPTMPAEVWLDADGLPRRMAYEMSMGLEAGTAPMTVRVSMDMFDFGQPVTVTPPADNDVADGGDLFGAADRRADIR